MSFIEPPPFGPDDPPREQPTPEPPPPEEPVSEQLRLLRLRQKQEGGYGMLSEEEEAQVKPLNERPEVKPLSELLEEPDEEKPERIHGLTIIGGNSLITASYKVGKTVLLMNIARSLVDGNDFLDHFEVEPLDGNVICFNYELPGEQFKRWLRMHKIHEVDRVIPVNLRGRQMQLQREPDFEWMAETIAKYEGEAVLVDPLAVAVKGDLNKGDVAGAFTQGLDKLKLVAGAKDAFITAHSGHPRSLSRTGVQTNLWAAGHSRFMGWADHLMTYTEARSGTRLLSSRGRYDDDEVPELELSFDRKTKRLSYVGKTGRTVKVEEAPDDLDCRVMDFVGANPWVSGRAIEKEVGGNHAVAREVVRNLADDGVFVTKPGPHRATLYAMVGAVDAGDV